jgi:hypothetical protein
MRHFGRFFGWIGHGLWAGIRAVYGALAVLSTIGGAIALILWILTFLLH